MRTRVQGQRQVQQAVRDAVQRLQRGDRRVVSAAIVVLLVITPEGLMMQGSEDACTCS